MQKENTKVQVAGTLQQGISNCLAVLDILLTDSNPIVSSMMVAEKDCFTDSAKNIVETVAYIFGMFKYCGI